MYVFLGGSIVLSSRSVSATCLSSHLGSYRLVSFLLPCFTLPACLPYQPGVVSMYVRTYPWPQPSPLISQSVSKSVSQPITRPASQPSQTRPLILWEVFGYHVIRAGRAELNWILHSCIPLKRREGKEGGCKKERKLTTIKQFSLYA